MPQFLNYLYAFVNRLGLTPIFDPNFFLGYESAKLKINYKI